MAPEKQSGSLTALLSNAALSRLERLRMQPRRQFTDKRRGEHLAGRSGTSNEFSDYRNYVEGDDVRFLDWNIFARLHRPYMKLYLEEEELHVSVMIDASGSMGYAGKLPMACRLAAAFGMMGLLGGERVSVYAFNTPGQGPSSYGPARGRAAMRDMFAFIERLQAGGDMPVEQAVETVLARHSGRGVTVLLSDFLSFGDLRRAFNGLFSAGQEIFALQILSEEECFPEIAGDARLVDSETGQTLDVSATAQLLEMYHAYRRDLERRLSAWVRGRGGRFDQVNAAEDAEEVLFNRLRRRGWLR